jgi:hypothetical protein
VSVLLERSGEQRQIGLVRKRKGGELKSTETYRNGKKRNGAGEVGRNVKYRNGKKEKGSRKVGEN